MSDRLDALRADVARHEGAARVRPLLALGAALADDYWRAGPGRPAALPRLDEAIGALDEAYDLLEPGEYLRGQVAGQLGWLLAARHTAHGGPAEDRETGIRMLEEASSSRDRSPIQEALARLSLGQLLLSRAFGGLRGGADVMHALTSGVPPARTADVDRAIECFQQALDTSAASAEMATTARALLGTAEAVRTVLGALGGRGGLDLNAMMQALTSLQALQQQMAGARAGYGARVPSPFDLQADALAGLGPLDRPVPVIDGPPPATPPPRPGAPRADVAAATALRARLSALLPGDGALLDLLAVDAPALDVATVDQLVAAASALLDAGGTEGVGHLPLAVSLYVRGTFDGDGGWDDGEGPDDMAAAAASLLAARPALVTGAADTVAVAVRLATLLDERAPEQGLLAALGAELQPAAEALRGAGAGGLLYSTAGYQALLSVESGQLGPVVDALPERLVVVGDGPVPDTSTVSTVASAAQVVELAARARRPLGESVVFVANPRDDRPQATLDALVLRRTFHARSLGFGHTAENVDGDGTPEEVRARLDASLLHLGCGVSPEGALELAGGRVLEPGDIAGGEPARVGGLALLPPAAGAAALTRALLASRFAGVIGFREPVPEHIASLVYLVLHAQLVDEGRDPASAVHAVRTWLADPRRPVPDYLPDWCTAVAVDPGTAERANWSGLVYHGL